VGGEQKVASKTWKEGRKVEGAVFTGWNEQEEGTNGTKGYN